jgi:hypothetical protein
MTICGSHSLSVHWMFHAYSLCTGTCVEVEMKGLVVSVFFSSVPGEHLTLHKKQTSAGNCLFVKPIVTFFGRCQLGITRIFKIKIKVHSM